MEIKNCVPGQRWISNAESELGLGIVVELENRQVVITFPAAAEQRTYTLQNAPLSRVIFRIGDRIKSADGHVGKITEIRDHQSRKVYSVEADDGRQFDVDELDLDSFMRFSQPQDRLRAGQVDKLTRFELRVLTLQQQFRLLQSKVYGLSGPRVQLLPHQLYIASRVGVRFEPRVLLADEVGLGKTIEAGLILHQQLLVGYAHRVLIVVPDSLIYQWLVEMLRRFNLRFSILEQEHFEVTVDDSEEPDLIEDEPENLYESAQLVISPLSLLAKNATAQQQALEARWDMVVVDEAHHLEWSPQQASDEYRVIEQLAAQTAGLLLLTATPEQLGVEGHFARLRLLDPQRYFDLQKFQQEEADYKPVSELAAALLSMDIEQPLLAELRDPIIQFAGEEALAEFEVELSGDDPEQARQDLLDSLLDRHGTGRVLFRNTRHNVSGFPGRSLQTYSLPAPEEFTARQSGASLQQLLKPEQLLGSGWLQRDPRVIWLAQWLKSHRSDKVLIICSAAQTAIELEEHLRLREGIQCVAFHEAMTLVARDRAAAYFADEEEPAQALICSEIGSEGRNFQFAHHLVFFDLPLEPDLVEQRIGRLDRIGQRKDVHIHVPHYADTAQQWLMEWFHRGLNAFESVCPAGATVFAEFRKRLIACLTNEDQTEFSLLLDETARRTVELEQRLQEGRNPLLELNSCHPQRAVDVVEQVAADARALELADYMEQVFDQFGVEMETHSNDAVIIRPGDGMLTQDFPELPEEGLTATYLRSKALSREDMQFLTWEHPMVTGAMESLLNSDFGNTSLGTIKIPPLKPGTLLVEAIYVLHCPAPARLRLQRYLKQPLVRILLDSKGNNLSKVLPMEKLNPLIRPAPKASRAEIVKHLSPQIEEILKNTEDAASGYSDEIIAEALQAMRHELHLEQQRLQSLAEVNANIRKEEIHYIEQAQAMLETYIYGAKLKLDAVRIVVAV